MNGLVLKKRACRLTSMLLALVMMLTLCLSGTAFAAGGAPVYNEDTGCTVSSDLKTITFTFDRDIKFASENVERSYRTHICVSEFFSSYSPLSSADEVEIDGNKLIVRLDEAFTLDSNRVIILGSTLASLDGDVLVTEVRSPYINARKSQDSAPQYESVSYNPAKKQIRIFFDEEIRAVSSSSLKRGVTIARARRAEFESLSAYDSVEVYDETSILITLDEGLSGDESRIQIASGIIKGVNGNVQEYSQVTDYIDANEATYEDEFEVELTMSEDMMIADLVFDRNIESNYPYDTDLEYLKTEISVMRDSIGGYNSLSSYDIISINGRTLRIEFQRALAGDDVIRINKNALKDSYGNVLAEEVKVGPNLSSSDAIFDPEKGVHLSSDKRTLTLSFNENVYNNMASISSLAEMIRVAYDGENFEMLDEDTEIDFQTYGQLTIEFSRSLSNENARVKILAGALQDKNRETITEEITTNPLGETDESLKVHLGNSRVFIATKTDSRDSSGNTISTVTMNPTKTAEAIAKATNNTKLSFALSDAAYGGTFEISGTVIRQLAALNATLEFSCSGVVQRFLASEIGLEEAAEELGVSYDDLTLKVSVCHVESPYSTDLSSKASAKNFVVLTTPIELSMVYTDGSDSYAITKYDEYSTKYFAVKSSYVQNRNITAVRVETSGKVNPIPTKITQIDGVYYLESKTRSNGVYGVIFANRAFTDTPTWAQPAVNSLASRMILQGANATAFRANEAVNRAEVAEMVTRALGILTDKSGASKFLDVTLTDWYFASVAIAVEYNIIRGYEDNTFGPERNITRQEVMTIMARVMRFLDGEDISAESELTIEEAEQILSRFEDAESVSDWAKLDMAECVQAEVVKGDNKGNLNPHANLTRAEMSQLIYNLLVEYSLISA